MIGMKCGAVWCGVEKYQALNIDKNQIKYSTLTTQE